MHWQRGASLEVQILRDLPFLLVSLPCTANQVTSQQQDLFICPVDRLHVGMVSPSYPSAELHHLGVLLVWAAAFEHPLEFVHLAAHFQCLGKGCRQGLHNDFYREIWLLFPSFNQGVSKDISGCSRIRLLTIYCQHGPCRAGAWITPH